MTKNIAWSAIVFIKNFLFNKLMKKGNMQRSEITTKFSGKRNTRNHCYKLNVTNVLKGGL